MDNETLLKLKKKLKHFFCYFKHENILVVSEDKTDAPFAYVIYDETYPDRLLLSLAIDYPTAINVAQLVLIVRNVSKVSLSEPFFISATDGKTHIGQDAFHRMDLESLNLDSLSPPSNERH